MSSSSTNLNSKGFSFLNKPPAAPVDNASTDASTITRAYQIVYNKQPHPQPHFTQSQFSATQKLSEYDLLDDSAQRPKCVQPSVELDYPRYMDPPHMGIVPCDGYDVSEFGPPNPEKSYDFPLACPACGGQMILRCVVNGSGMITRHSILHGETIHRSFEIVPFRPPENEGRIARDIALEDEIPSMLLGGKSMDDASIDGTECDFETQNIILEELQKHKSAATRTYRGREKVSVNKTNLNFGETGFGSDNEGLEEELNIPANLINTTSVKVVRAKKTAKIATEIVSDTLSPCAEQTKSGSPGAESPSSGSPSAEPIKSGSPSAEPTNSGSPSAPSAVNANGEEGVRAVRLPHEVRGAYSLNASLHADEPPFDHVLTFEKWRFKADWKFGIFIDSSTADGLKKLEIYTPRDGRIFIDVRDQYIIPNVTTCSDLIAFKPENATDKTFIVRPVRYHSTLVSGRTKVRFGRELTTEVIALSACSSEPLEALVNRGGNIQLWSDMTGLIDAPAIEVRKLLAGSMFLPIHLYRIRISISLVQNSPVTPVGPWKLLRMEAVFETDSKLEDLNVPDYYWPAGAQRLDDLSVKEAHRNEVILSSRAYPDRVIVAPVSYCRITLNNREKTLTAIMVPRLKYGENQWIALLAAPIQIAMEITNDRLFNFAPKTREHAPIPIGQEIIDKVKSLSEALQSRLVSKDHPLQRYEKLDMIMGTGGTPSELERHRLAVYRSLQGDADFNVE